MQLHGRPRRLPVIEKILPAGVVSAEEFGDPLDAELFPVEVADREDDVEQTWPLMVTPNRLHGNRR